jgi:opacity protein-like surface antigen
MKKMIKSLVGVFCALFLVTSMALAANTVTNAPTSLFNAGEIGLTLGSGYNVGTAGNVKGSTVFTEPYALNFNAGAFYFPWRNLGFEASVPFYSTKGVSVQEVEVGSVLRLPLSKTTPILKNIAPYVGVGGIYNWQTAQDWAYVGKVGTEFRLNSKWGVFVEGQYRNFELKNFEQGNVSLNGGVRFVF